MKRFGEGSVSVGPANPGEGPPRRCAITAEALVTAPFKGIETTYDVVEHTARTHRHKRAFGHREIIAIHEEKKIVDGKEKIWKYFELSEYKYISFVEVKEQVDAIAKGLLELGIEEGQVWNVYSQTSMNWQLFAQACASVSITIATSYDTLGPSGLAYSLNEPHCVGVFTNADLLPTLASIINEVPTIKYIIYDGEPSDSIELTRNDITLFSLSVLISKGHKSTISPDTRRPKPSTTACIMYTSGSTGPPKGVCMSQSNLIASVGGVYHLLVHLLREDDTYLAYLPLAHSMEYIVELIMFFVGMPIGFARVKTLTDTSVRNCVGDIRELKPSIMVGVPAVWEMIRKGILAKVSSGGILRKSMFDAAVLAKKHGVPVIGPVMDSLVLSNVREATGGRLRLALSGGAALSKETQEFLNVALVTILQGYGLTETCGMCAVLPPELMQYGAVGLPVPCCEVKLVDITETGYLSSNDPPQGEICIRGPSVVKGYFKRDDLNNDPSIFAPDGFFHTGDIGQWNPDGTLSIIDRIKNLVKLQGGEYIALEKLESVYRACNYVANICVHAETNAKQPIAIIVPHEANLRHGLEGIEGIDPSADMAVLCESPIVKAIVLEACNSIGKKNGFKSLELLQAVVLTPREWTPQSGLVTAAQKIQRKPIAKEFEKEIREAYMN